MRRLLKKTGYWLFPAVVMLFTILLLKYVFLLGYVPTESMEPTLKRGSYIIGCRIYSDLEVDDIIVFQHDGKLLVKRIAAVEGDIIERNGVSIKVPEGCYYVLGDNVDNSYDSRYWINPFIRKRDIVARLLIY